MVVFWGVCAHRLRWMGTEIRISWQFCTLTGHSETVSSVAFSSDGKRIASGSFDKSVIISNVPIPTKLQVRRFVGVS